MRLQTVHLRVNDESTGQPTACRIRITDSTGQEYAPFGHYLDFPTHRGESVGGRVKINGARWFSIPGTCEIALPPGDLRVQVRKGLSYVPIDERVNLPAGKMALRFMLACQPCITEPMPTSIDTRCHFMSSDDAALDAAAEDIDMINLLIEPILKFGVDGNCYRCTPNLSAFSGQAVLTHKHGAYVVVNTHNRHPVLGSIGLLHSHRPVFPLSFGAPDDTDDWSLRDWAGQCHRKGGLVVWTEPFGSKITNGGEALALAVLGEIDAYELTPDNLPNTLRRWYQLLNAGIRLPIVGASGRDANDRPVGAMRTIAYPREGQNWIDIKRGQSVTNGPQVATTNDGKNAYCSVVSATPFDRAELILNGNVIATCQSNNSEQGYLATFEHTVAGVGWLAARVIDARKSSQVAATPVFGHTSATVFGEPEVNPDARAFLRDQLGKSREWVESQGRFDDPKSKAKLLDTFNEAISKLS